MSKTEDLQKKIYDWATSYTDEQQPDLKKKIMAALDDRLKLLMFTDTDSLCYAVKTPDIYKDMEEHEDNLE